MRNLVLLLTLAAAFTGVSAAVPSNAIREVRVDRPPPMHDDNALAQECRF